MVVGYTNDLMLQGMDGMVTIFVTLGFTIIIKYFKIKYEILRATIFAFTKKNYKHALDFSLRLQDFKILVLLLLFLQMS